MALEFTGGSSEANLVGEGGSGWVSCGVLPTGKDALVKRLEDGEQTGRGHDWKVGSRHDSEPCTANYIRSKHIAIGTRAAASLFLAATIQEKRGRTLTANCIST